MAFDDESGEWVAPDETYEITVAFDEKDPTIVNITNIWDGGMTVQGQYDEAKGTITVPNMQVIYVHPTYGDVWIQGLTADLDDDAKGVTFSFTPLGGKLKSTPMAARCGAGDFSWFYLDMEHK